MQEKELDIDEDVMNIHYNCLGKQKLLKYIFYFQITEEGLQILEEKVKDLEKEKKDLETLFVEKMKALERERK